MLAPAAEVALRSAGLEVQVLQQHPGFVRLSVSQGIEVTLVDIAFDFRLLDRAVSDLGPVLDPEELAADKVLALWGRALPRDFVDVYALVDRFGLDRCLGLAGEKDRGFQPHLLREAFRRFPSLPRAAFPLDDNAYRQLGEAVVEWSTRLPRDLSE